MSEVMRLLVNIMDDHGVGDKQLAFACGLDRSTINRYKNGELMNIPTQVFAALWRITQDQRCFEPIKQGSAVVFIQIPKPVGGIDMIKGLIAAKKKRLAVEEKILEMLDDEVIDGNDDIAEYLMMHDEAMAAEVLLAESIKAEYRRNTNK